LGFARKEREPDVDFKIQFGGEQDLQSSLGKFFCGDLSLASGHSSHRWKSSLQPSQQFHISFVSNAVRRMVLFGSFVLFSSFFF
jgi:hypothetical protein